MQCNVSQCFAQVGRGKAIPAGGTVGSLVEGAPAVLGLDGAGMAGLVSVAEGASVLVVVGSVVVFFFLEKRAFNLSIGESASTRLCVSELSECRWDVADRQSIELTTHVGENWLEEGLLEGLF